MILGEFVEQLAAQLAQQQVQMPFEDERHWHELFYEFKKSDWQGKPAFLHRLRFDWDGPYPKSYELSEFLQALHWNACVDARNPHFDRITLSEGIAAAWSRRFEGFDEPTRNFLMFSAARAREVFGAVAF
jgi:hypothetical protein